MCTAPTSSDYTGGMDWTRSILGPWVAKNSRVASFISKDVAREHGVPGMPGVIGPSPSYQPRKAAG